MSSFMAQRILFSPHTFGGGELIVLSALAWHSDQKGSVSTVSAAALARLSRLSEKQIARVLKKLVSKGAILMTPGRGRGHHTAYTLNLQIFNSSKRSIANKGGVVKVFSDAALDAKVAALNANRIGPIIGDVPLAHLTPNCEFALLPTNFASRRRLPDHLLKPNSLQRRVSRDQWNRLSRLARQNADNFHRRFFPHDLGIH